MWPLYPLRASSLTHPPAPPGVPPGRVSGGWVVRPKGSGVEAGSGAPGAAQQAAGPATPAPGAGRLPDRVWTVPNLLSVARLVGVPVFMWLVLGPHENGLAVVLLVAASATDWLDGKIARAWHQESRLGQVLDPAADRLYIAAMLIALAVRAIIPWWLVGLLVARELVLGAALLALRARGYGPLQVSFVGKAATLCLLYAFPLLLLGAYGGTAALVARVIGWAFVYWGTALYWWAAGLYLAQARQLVTGTGTGAPGGRAGAGRS
jgi:cardiolipin synthase (CMP-forming)